MNENDLGEIEDRIDQACLSRVFLRAMGCMSYETRIDLNSAMPSMFQINELRIYESLVSDAG